jgi:hypothetical protein
MAITLEINGVDKTSLIKKRSLNYTLRGDGIASASFILNSTANSYMPGIGQTIEILDGATVLYGGLIKTAVKSKLTPAFGNTTDIEISVSCDGYNTIPSRRTITYEAIGNTTGDIIANMRTLYLNAEGVGAGTISAGITIPYYLAVCKSIAQVFDELAKASGYKWYIDKDKELYFIDEEAIVDADVDLVESGAFTDFHNVIVTETFKDYRNKTFVKGNFGVDGKLVVVSSEDAAEIAARAAIEGGTGVHGYVIESQEITTEADALAVAELDVQKYGFAPIDLQFSSYTTDWVPGTRLKVNLPALGIASDTYFLIDEVHVVRVDNDILKSTIRGTKRREGLDFSTQRTQSGNDYFVELVREAKRKGGGGIGGGAGGGVIGSAVKSYYDTNAAAVNVDTDETLVVEKTFTMAVASNIFISASAKITANADLNITSIIYVTEPGEAEAALTYQPSQDLLNGKIYTLTHTDTVEAVAAGDVTIKVVMVTDTDDFDIAALQATLSIITVPNLSVTIPIEVGDGYIFGGLSGGGVLKTCDAYVLLTNSWTNKSDMGNPARRQTCAASVGGKGYVYTGNSNPTGTSRIDNTDEYNPVSNGWTAKTAHVERAEAGYTSIGIYALRLGGLASSYTKDCSSYNTTADTWAAITDKAVAESRLCGFKIGGYAYTTAGFTGLSAGQAECNRLDFVANTWSAMANLPSARYFACAVEIEEFGYVFGGLSSSVYQKTCYQYNADTNTWSTKTEMPNPGRANSAVYAISNQAFVSGGYDGTNELADCDSYDPLTDAWTSNSDLIAVRRDISGCTI